MRLVQAARSRKPEPILSDIRLAKQENKKLDEEEELLSLVCVCDRIHLKLGSDHVLLELKKTELVALNLILEILEIITKKFCLVPS